MFPLGWKKDNLIPTYKKIGKQCLRIYLPVTILPVSSKSFEKPIFNELLKCFYENNIVPSKQFGFKPGDSHINQSKSITHEMYESLDAGLGVRSVFLHISKSFDKVWHEGILFRLYQNRILVNLLKLLTDFLKNLKQRVTPKGQTSSWKIFLDQGKCRSSSRFNTSSNVVFDLNKWFTWWLIFKC